MISRFFRYYAPYKSLFMLDFGCAIIAGLLELAFPVAVQTFIDDLLPGKHWELIVWASIGLLALYLLNMLFMYIVNYWGHMLGINIETDMSRDYKNTEGSDLSDQLVAYMVNATPLGRGGSPSEIAEAIYWLSSEAASFITGTTLTVDGGFMSNLNDYSIKKMQFPTEF